MATERKVVLQIDSPELDTITDFSEARPAEVLQEKDPLFSEWDSGLLMTRVVIRLPDDGPGVLRSIRQQWENREIAWARQYLPTDDTLEIRIVGITVVSETPDDVIFRLYTPE